VLLTPNDNFGINQTLVIRYQTLRINFPDKNAAVETYRMELNPNPTLVTALLLIGPSGGIIARYNLIGK